jgi:T5SS/PEP-CTERM-associated repeat protein/autotransporter-associated beta strand protein
MRSLLCFFVERFSALHRRRVSGFVLATLVSLAGISRLSAADLVVNGGADVVISSTNEAYDNAYVGQDDSNNTLTISNATLSVGGFSFIGSEANSSNNSVLVTGSNSLLTNTQDLLVGNFGSSNSLTISNGGEVSVGGWSWIGNGPNSSNNWVLVTGSGSAWTNAGFLYVGGSGSSNSLVISNGGKVSVAPDTYIGTGDNSSNNSVLVTDSNSLLTTGTLQLGRNGSSNSLVITNGGEVSVAGDFYIGFINTSSNNTVLVTGSGSAWTNGQNLQVGYEGSGNSLVISNGGEGNVGGNSYIGREAGSSNNSVLVTGAGSRWTTTADLFVGNSGFGNSLVVSNEGTVSVGGNSYIGNGVDSSNNSVLVTGAGSVWTNAWSLYVGASGSGNRLDISEGGNVFAGNLAVGQSSNAANNTLLVTGSNSLLSFWEGKIGLAGSSNSLVVSNGAKVTNGWTYIGTDAGSDNNSVVITGDETRWDGEVDFNVGYSGSSNTLLVSDGATLIHGGHFRGATLGFSESSSNNSAIVTGSNSSWTSTADFFVGYGGSGNSLVISNGGAVSNARTYYSGAYIGNEASASNNSVIVTGSNSSWTSAADFYVGYAGSGNTLLITNGGLVSVASASFVGSEAGSTGNSVLVTGASSMWTNSGNFLVGNQGSANTLTISDGGGVSVLDSSFIGNGSNSTGNVATVTGAGSGWTSGHNFWIGREGSGNSMNVLDGGTVSVGADGVVGGSIGASNNTLTISSSQWINRGSIYIGGGSNSVTVTNGGTLSVSGYTFVAPNAAEQGNSILVTGRGSEWTNTLNVYFGDYGSGNTLEVFDEGKVSLAENLAIAYYADASNNTVIVSGTRSSLATGATITVGREGSGNRVVVTNGGVVSAVGTIVGELTNSSGNSVLVTGADSLWTNSSAFYVGNQGSTNSLVISNGGTVNAFYMAAGSAVSANHNQVIVGSNSTITVADKFDVGFDGSSNSLVITDGGNVFLGNGGSSIGSFLANGNSVLVTGAGSTLSNTGIYYVGFQGAGNRLTLSNQATLISDELTAGGSVGGGLFGSNNAILVTSNASMLISGLLSVGGEGAGNAMTVSGGGTVQAQNSSIGNTTTASNNSVLVTGAGSTWTNSGDLFVGNQGSGNSLVISNGGAVVNVDGGIGWEATSSNNSVLVTGAGSAWTNSGNLVIGQNGSGNSLVISNGGFVVSVNGYISYSNPASNSVLVTGVDSIWTNSGNLYVGSSGGISNSLTVANEGKVGAGTISIAGSGSALNIGRRGENDTAGTIMASAIEFGAGSGAVNFNQTNTFALTNVVVGDGSLNQLGSGTLLLGGDLGAFTGSVSVSVGTIVISNLADLGGTTDLFMASGGTFDVSQSGTNTISLDMSVTNGTGTIVNSGGGTLVLDGALTKSGSILVLAGGDFVVNGVISGSGAPGSFNSDLVLGSDVTPGPATVTINTAATYVGPTIIRAGSTLINGTNNVLPDSTVVTLGDAATDTVSTVNRYDMQGFNETIGGLASAGSASNVVVGSGTLRIAGTSSTVFNGLLDGAMALVRAGAGSTTLAGPNTYAGGTTIESGRLIAGNAAALGTGGVTLLGGTLQLQSQLDIASLFWDGAGKIAIPNPAAGHFVNIAGALTLSNSMNFFDLTGATVNAPVKLLAAPGVSTNSLSLFGVEGFDTNALSYTLSYIGDELWLSFIPKPVPTYPDFTQYALTPNQHQVATALNQWAASNPTGDRETVLNAATNSGNYPAAFEQMLPTPYASLPNMAFNTANALNSVMFQRLWMTRINGRGFSVGGMNLAPMQAEMGGVDDMAAFAISPSKDTKWGTFVDGNGIFANGGDVAYLQNYRSQSGGVTAGASYKWNDNLATGVYAGYQGLQAEYSNGRTIDNAVRFGVFGTYDIDNFYINALVGGAYHGYTVNRYINFGGLDRTATGRPGAGEFDLALNTGYDFKAGDFAFGPFTGMQYTYVGVQGFTETGADSINLDVDPYNTSSLLYTLGAQAAYNWKVSSKVIVTPTIFAGWQHEFLQDAYQINSSFNTGGPASPFSYTTGTPARDNFYGGVGATVGLGDRWQATAIYSAFVGGQNQNSQNLYLGLGMTF